MYLKNTFLQGRLLLPRLRHSFTDRTSYRPGPSTTAPQSTGRHPPTHTCIHTLSVSVWSWKTQKDRTKRVGCRDVQLRRQSKYNVGGLTSPTTPHGVSSGGISSLNKGVTVLPELCGVRKGTLKGAGSFDGTDTTDRADSCRT